MFCCKFFKKITLCRGSLLCFGGMPLEKATRFVGIADVIFGMTFFSYVYLHENEIKYNVQLDQQSTSSLNDLPHWLCYTIMVSHAIKFLMGIVVYMGAIIRSRKICRFWLFTSIPIAIFAFPTNLLHLYEMLVVNQFSQEIHNEETKVGIDTPDPFSPTTPLKSFPGGKSPNLLSTRHKIFSVSQTMLDNGNGPLYCWPKSEITNQFDNNRYIGFGNTNLMNIQPSPIRAVSAVPPIEVHSVQFHYPPPLPLQQVPPLAIPTPSLTPSPICLRYMDEHDQSQKNSLTPNFQFLSPLLPRSPCSSSAASYIVAIDSDEDDGDQNRMNSLTTEEDCVFSDNEENNYTRNLVQGSRFYGLLPSNSQPQPAAQPRRHFSASPFSWARRQRHQQQQSSEVRNSLILPVVLVTGVDDDSTEAT